MITVGHRSLGGDAWTDQGRLSRSAAFLRGSPALVPRGVFRFRSFDDDAPDNVALVKRALAVLADNAAADLADEVIVDLMGRACGIGFAEAAADAETLERDGVAIRVASPQTLIRLKDTPRPQDALDRAFLEGASPAIVLASASPANSS